MAQAPREEWHSGSICIRSWTLRAPVHTGRPAEDSYRQYGCSRAVSYPLSDCADGLEFSRSWIITFKKAEMPPSRLGDGGKSNGWLFFDNVHVLRYDLLTVGQRNTFARINSVYRAAQLLDWAGITVGTVGNGIDDPCDFFRSSFDQHRLTPSADAAAHPHHRYRSQRRGVCFSAP